MTFKAFNLKKIGAALLYILAPLVLGFAVSQIVGNTRDFYLDLQKPPLSPPAIVFPIAWTLLYLLLGIASYLSRECTAAINLFYIGLAMNYAWVFFFFGFHLIGFSAFWLVLLLAVSVLNTISFFKCNTLSGYLMLPYLAWLCFALYLNLGILILN